MSLEISFPRKYCDSQRPDRSAERDQLAQHAVSAPDKRQGSLHHLPRVVERTRGTLHLAGEARGTDGKVVALCQPVCQILPQPG